MANSYAGGAFNIDTSTNVAGLTTLKGGAPAGTDSIYIYNGATLTVESALAILLISLGETSAGAAADGQRVGHVTVNAGVTITFTGDGTATNSGIKSNPASAPGTALESKGIRVTLLGTVASGIVLTNAGDAYDANKLWTVYVAYGSVLVDYVTFKWSGLITLNLALSTSYTTATSQSISHATFYCGCAAWSTLRPIDCELAANNIPLTVLDVAVSCGTTALGYVVVYGSPAAGATCRVSNATVTPTGGATLFFCSVYVYSDAAVYWPTADASLAAAALTETVPAGLAVANPSPTADGELVVTWTNGASYAAGDKLVVYNASGDAVLAILDATLGTGRICGLTNASAYTVYAKATSDNYVFSAATANVGPTTCTGTDTPTAANTRTTDTVRGVTGTCTVPAAGDLKSGVQVGAAGTEVTGTRVDAAAGNVLAGSGNIGDPGSPIVPTLTLPAAGDARYGSAAYGNPASQVTPTCKVPVKANVRVGIPVDVSDTGSLLVNPAVDLRSS